MDTVLFLFRSTANHVSSLNHSSFIQWKDASSCYLVQTAHVNSRPATYGPHGSEPQALCTEYSKAPFLLVRTSRSIFWIFVNANEITGLLVAVIFSHQVPMILLGPSRWTVIPCGHHQHGTTWLDEAHNANCIMVMWYLSWKGRHCSYWLHTLCRTCIPSSASRFCTCRTLDCLEGKGSLLHHQVCVMFTSHYTYSRTHNKQKISNSCKQLGSVTLLNSST